MTRERIKEAYRLALAEGRVAQYRGLFRDGRSVKFRIEQDVGFSDGVETEQRVGLAGDFQLRYVGDPRQRAHPEYAVYGRADGQNDSDWFIVDGPWRVGQGPFDGKTT